MRQVKGVGPIELPRSGTRSKQTVYSPAPTITIGIVGTNDPCSGSTVIANVLASTPGGNCGLITVALPWTSGLNTPAGISATVHKPSAEATSANCWPGKSS